tara:strand:+ start:35 stop:562 length:528 start_codon:yes stop_codon:yes gene_type:complete
MKCTTCKEDKPEDYFYLRKDTKKRRRECTQCITEKRKLSYHKDIEKTKAKQKASYLKHRSKRLVSHRDYYIKNKDKALWLSARNRARQKGLPFDIAVEDINIPENCPILGIKIARDNSVMKDDSPTLDRLYPELGYVKGNVNVISNKANRMKNDATVEEVSLLLEWLKEASNEHL